MITWIRNNVALFSLATSLVVFIAGAAVGWHQLNGLVADQPAVENHIHDSARHIDPVRDAESQKQLMERIEKLEERLNRMESRRGNWGGGWQGRTDHERGHR